MEIFNIGIDFGGVLSVHDGPKAKHINVCVDIEYVEESLQKLKDRGHNLFLISFCGRTRAIETKKSLDESGLSRFFTSQTYVKKRDYKRQICELNNCHFMIDDREDILRNVLNNGSNTIPILFGKISHPEYICANDWRKVIDIITNTKYFDATSNVTYNTANLTYNV